MGRRALPKIDPALDLNFHLLTVDQLPPLLTADSLFARSSPLELEVGCGKGLFLVTASGQQPDRCYVGVEIAARYARFTAARLARQQRTNARVIHGDAVPLLEQRIPDASLQAIHVYFPDPWWKQRHRKRRVMNPRFLAGVARTLAPGGCLHFWTDVAEYFSATLELIATRAPDLTGPLAVAENPPTHDLDYRTHFERRMRQHAAAVHRAVFVRRGRV